MGISGVQLQNAQSPLGKIQLGLYLMNALRGDFHL